LLRHDNGKFVPIASGGKRSNSRGGRFNTLTAPAGVLLKLAAKERKKTAS
jgi:hypothetical protein